jgi:hypothetical protein
MSASHRPARYMSQPTTATSAPSTAPITNPAEVLSRTPFRDGRVHWRCALAIVLGVPARISPPPPLAPLLRSLDGHPRDARTPTTPGREKVHSGFVVVLGSGDLKKDLQLRPQSSPADRPLVQSPPLVGVYHRLPHCSLHPFFRRRPQAHGQGQGCIGHPAIAALLRPLAKRWRRGCR